MIDVYLLDFKDKSAVESFIKEYIDDETIEVIVTDSVEDILDYPNNENRIWADLTYPKAGDVKTCISIYGENPITKDCSRLFKWLGTIKRIENISNMDPSLKDNEFVLVDSIGRSSIVEEDFDFSSKFDGAIKILRGA